ncbi:hypothetical protein WG68_12295 [Arsukibacterium ikkense]|uniref:Uncharacterized protein n=2 Tax=Arsukibacterium ikkense TaxID=336831 RepID=A0A0M2V485_9GAMM|nr:hypothetical protein WG68_12295 [Arsukibacterium ikkense]
MSAKTIREINDKYRYEDKKPGGARDNSLVSCAQCDGYNELQYIYDTKLKLLVSERKITEDKAIAALEKACADLKNPRARTDFYRKLSEILGVVIK